MWMMMTTTTITIRIAFGFLRTSWLNMWTQSAVLSIFLRFLYRQVRHQSLFSFFFSLIFSETNSNRCSNPTRNSKRSIRSIAWKLMSFFGTKTVKLTAYCLLFFPFLVKIVECRSPSLLFFPQHTDAGWFGESPHSATSDEGEKRSTQSAGRFAATGCGGIEAEDGGWSTQTESDENRV